MIHAFGMLVMAATLIPAGLGQSGDGTGADLATPADLGERLKDLRAKAEAGDGSASVTLHAYPNHYTMLAYRNRDGGGELHERFADMFVVVEGRAVAITGGRLVDGHQSGSGEQRGTAVEGGSRQELNNGDILHIPAGMPHQLLVAKGEHFAYYVVKVQEK